MKHWNLYMAAASVVLLGCLLTASVQAAPPRDPEVHHHAEFRYPSRGAVVDRLPKGHRIVRYKGQPYHFHKGVWYRPIGNRFMVVIPPPGLLIPALPAGAVVVTIGGVPYYHYGGVYYVREDKGYRVVERPEEAPQVADPVSTDLFVYPRAGQSAEQQASDRFECHEWAADQTGYDPTLTGGGVSAQSRTQKRSDYLRAMTACLEARGYSVR